MFEIREMRRVGWLRRSGRYHCVGSLMLTDQALRLNGREAAGDLAASLTIPLTSIRAVRPSASEAEQLAGERSIVIELSDGDAVFLRPVGTAHPNLRLVSLLGRLQRAVGERPALRPAH
jgi:hypothetical protein